MSSIIWKSLIFFDRWSIIINAAAIYFLLISTWILGLFDHGRIVYHHSSCLIFEYFLLYDRFEISIISHLSFVPPPWVSDFHWSATKSKMVLLNVEMIFTSGLWGASCRSMVWVRGRGKGDGHFCEYRSARLQWHQLQWHNKEPAFYSDTFPMSHLVTYIIKMFGYSGTVKSLPLWVTLFADSQVCHCKRAGL